MGRARGGWEKGIKKFGKLGSFLKKGAPRENDLRKRGEKDSGTQEIVKEEQCPRPPGPKRGGVKKDEKGGGRSTFARGGSCDKLGKRLGGP